MELLAEPPPLPPYRPRAMTPKDVKMSLFLMCAQVCRTLPCVPPRMPPEVMEELATTRVFYPPTLGGSLREEHTAGWLRNCDGQWTICGRVRLRAWGSKGMNRYEEFEGGDVIHKRLYCDDGQLNFAAWYQVGEYYREYVSWNRREVEKRWTRRGIGELDGEVEDEPPPQYFDAAWFDVRTGRPALGWMAEMA